MAVAAQIQFLQPGGGGTGTPGQALAGNLALPVQSKNFTDNGQVQSWTWEVVDVPSGSGVATGVVQQGQVPTFTFTPDVRGAYLLHLTVRDLAGNFAEDYRVFQVAETTGRFIPSFKADAASYNRGGNQLGWHPDVAAYLKAVDAGGGGGVSLAGDLLGTGSTTGTPRVGTLTGVAGTLALATTAAALLWAAATTTPSLGIATTGNPTGTSLVVFAQTGGTTGGPLNLQSGAGSSYNNHGAINFQIGGNASLSLTHSAGFPFLNFDAAETAPTIGQATNGSGAGAGLFIQAQTGTAAAGGGLNLRSGGGSSFGDINLALGGNTAYQLSLQYNANVPRLAFSGTFVSPTFTQIGAVFSAAQANTFSQSAQANTSATANSWGGQLSLSGGATSSASVSAVGGAITGVSAATAAVVTTTSAHGLVTGQLVAIAGVVGTTGALAGINQVWPVTVLSSTTYSVPFNSTGLTWSSGGTTTPQGLGGPVIINSGASFSAATAGYIDLRTAGVSQMLISPAQIQLQQATSLVFGTTAMPTVGYVRFPSTGGVTKLLTQRDTINSLDLEIISTSANAYLLTVGDTGASGTHWSGVTLSAASITIQSSAGGVVNIGSSTTGFQTTVNGSQNLIAFNAGVAVTFKQIDVTGGSTNGQTLTVQAQNATGVTSNGGVLALTSGTGTTFKGALRLQAGGVTQLELANVVGSNRVVSLNRTTSLTSTEMPTNTGDLVMYVGNAATDPTANSVSGGILYSSGGAGKWRGTSGTVTTFGPAEPHCPRCKRDYALEWKNDQKGEHIAVCVPCMVAALEKHGVPFADYAITNKLKAA